MGTCSGTDEIAGAAFHRVSFRGATFRSSDASGVTMRGVELDGLDVDSGIWSWPPTRGCVAGSSRRNGRICGTSGAISLCSHRATPPATTLTRCTDRGR